MENEESELLILDSLEELEYVRDNLVVKRSKYEEYVWVAGSDMFGEGQWKWTTGGSVSDHLWNPGEPNNDRGQEDCAMFYNEKLNDAKCSSKHMFICKMSSKKNGFKNEMKLSDHLYNIENDVMELKMNMTLLNDAVQQLNTSSTTQDSTTTQ